MADIRDVLDALAALATGAVYPSGVNASSVTGRKVHVGPGWPQSDELNALIARGESAVSIYPADTERVTTRYLDDWQEHDVPTATITAAVGPGEVLLAGTSSDRHVVTLIVNGKAYSYAVLPTDTLPSIAASLAVLVNVDTPSTSSGARILMPAAARIVARIGVIGTGMRDLEQQEKPFRLIVWAPSEDDRTAIGRVLTPAVQRSTFIELADGTKGHVQYQRTILTDHLEKQLIYRRDVFLTVEWSTVETMDVATITSTTLDASQMVGDECVPILTVTA